MNLFHLIIITLVFSLSLTACDIPRNQRKTLQTQQGNTQSYKSLKNTSQPNTETCNPWIGCYYQE